MRTFHEKFKSGLISKIEEHKGFLVELQSRLYCGEPSRERNNKEMFIKGKLEAFDTMLRIIEKGQ